jgi:hypothetical protein
MARLGYGLKRSAKVYIVGGGTAVLYGWRNSTVDIDLKIVPETDEILRRLPKLKEELEINVELASRDDFIPPLPGWQERSQFIRREGSIDFFHYDFYAQALAKIERGHTADVADVDQMFKLKLIEPARLLQLFSEIEADLYKYPAIDPKSFRDSVETILKRHRGQLFLSWIRKALNNLLSKHTSVSFDRDLIQRQQSTILHYNPTVDNHALNIRTLSCIH